MNPSDGGDANDANETDATIDAGFVQDAGDADPCSPMSAMSPTRLPCDPVATCQPIGEVGVCACPSGYVDLRGDGTSCIDIDECAEGSADCDVLTGCINAPGGFGCGPCPAGYNDVNDDGRHCVDVDECAEHTDDCDPAGATCTNFTGTFTCECPADHLGDGHGAAGCIRRTLQVAAADRHTCAILAGGLVKCWGDGAVLGLGDEFPRGVKSGDMGDALPFVDLGTGRTALAISTGYQHSCALLDDHSIKCWGSNTNGALGIPDHMWRGNQPGQMGDALPAVALGAGRSALAITTGLDSTCALLDDGTVKCWGLDYVGERGQGTSCQPNGCGGEDVAALPAIALGTGRTAKSIVTRYGHVCAILDDDSLKCWGFNSAGGLGIGTTESRGDGPGEMGDALPVVELGAGRHALMVGTGAGHSCALLDDYNVKCWGQADRGQLGLGDRLQRGDEPGEMGDALPTLDLAASVAPSSLIVGGDHNCVQIGGTLKCWGENSSGQLGTGTMCAGTGANGECLFDDRGNDPNEMGAQLGTIDLGTGRSVMSAAAGASHTCVIFSDGALKCWGLNQEGQLGLSDLNDRGDEPGEMGDNLPLVDVGE